MRAEDGGEREYGRKCAETRTGRVGFGLSFVCFEADGKILRDRGDIRFLICFLREDR